MATNHDALDRFIKKEMARTGVPGVAVGIHFKGKTYTKGYGVTNVDHPLPVDDETLFQIGSTTKTFTATAMMRLVEQGKVNLADPIRKYLPDFSLRDKAVSRKATVLHLFMHTGGWLGDHFEDHGRGDDALTRVVEKMSKLKQLTPLGEVFSYNNAAFYVAGRIVEKVTNKPYETAIRELLFVPLGMDHSFFFAEEAITHRVVAGHITTAAGKSTVVRPWQLSRTANPAGGIISDVKEQLKWARFHMGDGRAFDGKRLLRKATVRKMQRAQAPAGSMADEVGISWLLRNVGGKRLVAHGGTTPGQLSAFMMVPDEGFAITVLTNSTRGGQVHGQVVKWALEHYLDIKQPAAEPIKVDLTRLASYAGKYRIEANGTIFDIVARSGGLTVKFPAPPVGPNGKKPPGIPPVPMYFFDDDRVMASKGPFKGAKAEFVRGANGRVAWFRFGGRIHRKIAAKR